MDYKQYYHGKEYHLSFRLQNYNKKMGNMQKNDFLFCQLNT